MTSNTAGENRTLQDGQLLDEERNLEAGIFGHQRRITRPKMSSSDYIDSSDEDNDGRAQSSYSMHIEESKVDDEKTKKKQNKGGAKQSNVGNLKPSGGKGTQGDSQVSGNPNDGTKK